MSDDYICPHGTTRVYDRKETKMGEIGKKAVLIMATFVVALMFIIPAAGWTSSGPREAGSSLTTAGTGSGMGQPGRRRRLIIRRHRFHRWHARRVHRARVWRRERRERREHRD